MTTQHQAPEVTRPIIGIENRTAQEVFDIMCDRFTRATQPLSLTVDEIRDVLEPFAKMGRMLGGPFAPVLFKDEDAIGMGAAWSENGEPRTITFGDLRRVNAALNRL